MSNVVYKNGKAYMQSSSPTGATVLNPTKWNGVGYETNYNVAVVQERQSDRHFNNVNRVGETYRTVKKEY